MEATMLFAALLTTILSAATPAQSATAAAQSPDPPVRVSLDHKSYQPGERAKVSVHARDDGYLLVLHMDPDGRLRVLFPLDRGDHWDYRVLGDSALKRDPEAGLTNLAQAMSDGHHFDYDVVTYDVVRTIAGETAPVYAPSQYYGDWGYDSWTDPRYWSP